MHKPTKKLLRLDTQTLRDLRDADLREAAGGGVTYAYSRTGQMCGLRDTTSTPA